MSCLPVDGSAIRPETALQHLTGVASGPDLRARIALAVDADADSLDDVLRSRGDRAVADRVAQLARHAVGEGDQ